ncbi:hypothetical protein ADIARSV_2622 [Arcticibacter svalbardensis MN12-7]|uniref:Trypsin-like peptidase domain-containing protein n=1 Tax=Arcticibacter svalbardensis MN12-7 TaxID=1150600 RepID=R9GR76_9SPHI|nr:hypothetical protein [Arcticibacter svalbardensis]EOR94206.1 hypothetical protein ADIARSV_2622 [Arcticibacter svalbardensis MN12-7]
MEITKNIDAVFGILGLSGDEKRRTIGTGFFINESGGFVTAAHTFKRANEGWAYFAIIEGKKIELNKLYQEYLDMESQVAPIHLDLYIGDFALDKKTNHLFFHPSSYLKNGDILEFSGYAGRYYLDKEATKNEVQKTPGTIGINIDDLWANTENDEEENELQEKNTESNILHLAPVDQLNWGSQIDNLKYSSITGVFKNHCFEKIFEYIPVAGVFTNGFTFQLTNAKMEPAGLSGGPIIKNKIVFGMLITKNAAITSEYIVHQLELQDVKFYLK